MTITGTGYNDKYSVNSWGEILDSSGWRTGFKINGNELLCETSSRWVTAGWLHSGGSISYASDYRSNKPFSGWSD